MGVSMFTQVVDQYYQFQLWRRGQYYYAVIRNLFTSNQWNTGFLNTPADAVSKAYEIIVDLRISEIRPSRFDIHNL